MSRANTVEGRRLYDDLYTALAEVAAVEHSTEHTWHKSGVSGGCIHDSAIFQHDTGKKYFVKQNTADKFPSLEHEAAGLRALKAADCIPCATPLALGLNRQENCTFLVLEIIESTPKQNDFWENFARRFAKLHISTNNEFYGWQHEDNDNRIAKRNSPHDDWISFFGQARLHPQLESASHYLGTTLTDKGQRLIAKLNSLIEPPPHPQLIHGDLWSGNFMVGNDGHAVLIDPAVYYGHGEADLAMTHLFGGFPPTFYDAYKEINPLSENYRQHADIYNLFHLLNHLNLFGRSYLAGVKKTIERYS